MLPAMQRDSLMCMCLLVTLSLFLACTKVEPGFDNTSVASKTTKTAPAIFLDNGVGDYSDFAKLLSAYVSESGLVNYAKLKDNRNGLDHFLLRLAAVSTQSLEARSRNEQIAFWINAYNAITLQSIINNYPISASFIKGLAFPKNSIRQIDGVWDKVSHSVAGQQLTLDAIEHQILREKFKEPRIHLALVCAAISCPPLRDEPYLAKELDQQFEQQTKRFMASDQGLQLGAGLKVSKIFKWFGDDFLWLYPELKNSEFALRKYLAQYATSAAAKKLLDYNEPLGYLDYNWSLNEQ